MFPVTVVQYLLCGVGCFPLQWYNTCIVTRMFLTTVSGRVFPITSGAIPPVCPERCFPLQVVQYLQCVQKGVSHYSGAIPPACQIGCFPLKWCNTFSVSSKYFSLQWCNTSSVSSRVFPITSDAIPPVCPAGCFPPQNTAQAAHPGQHGAGLSCRQKKVPRLFCILAYFAMGEASASTWPPC